MVKRRKYGLWTYLIAGVIILTNCAVIVAKFMGKDLGVAIPDALEQISRQIEFIGLAYIAMSVQKQTNGSHKRINKILEPEGKTNVAILPD